MFPFEYLLKNTNQWNHFVRVHLSGPYKIRTAQETNQNSPFHPEPVQPYNKLYYNKLDYAPSRIGRWFGDESIRLPRDCAPDSCILADSASFVG